MELFKIIKKLLTKIINYGIISLALYVIFFMHKLKVREVEVLRTKITLACTDCKQRNYNTMKDKKVHPDRMETKKYCKFCGKHTLHRETK